LRIKYIFQKGIIIGNELVEKKHVYIKIAVKNRRRNLLHFLGEIYDLGY